MINALLKPHCFSTNSRRVFIHRVRSATKLSQTTGLNSKLMRICRTCTE